MNTKKTLFWVLPWIIGLVIASVSLLIQNPTNMLRDPINEVQFVESVKMVNYYGWVFPVRCEEVGHFGIFIEGPACGSAFSRTLFIFNVILWGAIVQIILTLIFLIRVLRKRSMIIKGTTGQQLKNSKNE